MRAVYRPQTLIELAVERMVGIRLCLCQVILHTRHHAANGAYTGQLPIPLFASSRCQGMFYFAEMLHTGFKCPGELILGNHG